MYYLVPQVSLGQVSAQAADEATEHLHSLFHQILPICDDVAELEKKTTEWLDPRQLHIWRKHLDVVVWSRAWAALRARQKIAKEAVAEAQVLSLQ